MDINSIIKKVSDKEPLFTTLINNLRISNDHSQTPTAGTDGKNLYYNPEWFNKLTKDEAAGVILHETLHCAFEHPWRKEKRDHMRWNIACDYAINGIVNESFPLPKGCLLDSKYFGMSAEMIYDSLPKQKTIKMKSQSWGDHGMWGEEEQESKSKSGKKQSKSKQKGGGQGDKQKDKKQGSQDQEGRGEGKEGKENKNKSKGGESIKDILKKIFGQGKKQKRLTPQEQQEAQEEWHDLFKQQLVKNYGKLPESLKRIIEKSYYIPVIDWVSLVSSILSEDVSDYTFNSPDRRFSDADFVLPDLWSESKLKDVVFAYDTSGSISEQMLTSFYFETVNLFNNFSNYEGWVAVCDADLHEFKGIDRTVSFEEMGFTGGGGTDFRPVFDRVKEEGIRPKALFYFTDTFGEFPFPNDYPDYPVFWLVPSEVGDEEERSVPFGQVIKFLPKFND